MELFYAGGPNNKIFITFLERTGKKVNILKNYYELMDRDFKKEIISYQPYVDKIMLDSGAFSANNSLDSEDAEIIKRRYPYFLEQNKDFLKENIYRVFTYDFRFNKKDYMDNFILYTELREAYDAICPVIHRFTESVKNEEIEIYSDYAPPTIAIGQIISNKSREKRTGKDNISSLQATINSIKKIKSDCHLLGITEYKGLYNLQGYDTCDSKSWLEYATSGTAQIFWPPDSTNTAPITFIIKIPQYLKDKDRSVSIYNLPDADRTRFFDEMKKELQLDESDFNNSSSTQSLMLANLYYSTKMVEYLNNRPLQQLTSEAKTSPPAKIKIQIIPKNKNPFATPKTIKK